MPLTVSLKWFDQCLTMISLRVVYLLTTESTWYCKILLSKMNHYGIKGIPYEWFKSYLTGNSLQQLTTNSLNFQVLSLL